MAWLRKPGSRVLHIYDKYVPRGLGIGTHSDPAALAICGKRFASPHETNYHVNERVEGERICGHCARSARIKSLVLLARAEGRVVGDPTVRRRSKR